MPCECTCKYSHAKNCGTDDDVSVKRFLKRYASETVHWHYRNRKNDGTLPGPKGRTTSFQTNMISYLCHRPFTEVRLAKVKGLVRLDSSLLRSGEHPPLLMAFDQLLFDSSGDDRTHIKSSHLRWVQELLKLGCKFHGSAFQRACREYPRYQNRFFRKFAELVERNEELAQEVEDLKEQQAEAELTNEEELEKQQKRAETSLNKLKQDLDKQNTKAEQTKQKDLEKQKSAAEEAEQNLREEMSAALDQEKSVSINTLIQMKVDAQTQLKTLEAASLQKMYGSFIAAASAQIQEHDKISNEIEGISRRCNDVAARAKSASKDLQVLQNNNNNKRKFDVVKRDASRQTLAQDVPILLTEADSVLESIASVQVLTAQPNVVRPALPPKPKKGGGRTKKVDSGANNNQKKAMTPELQPEMLEKPLLKEFSHDFEASKKQYCDRLQEAIADIDVLFNGLASRATPSTDLNKVSTAIGGALKNCSVEGLRLRTDRVCPRKKVADLSEVTERMRGDLTGRSSKLKVDLQVLRVAYREHVGLPMAFAATSEVAEAKLEELLDASDAVDKAKFDEGALIKKRSRRGNPVPAAAAARATRGTKRSRECEEKEQDDPELQAATTHRQQAVREFRHKAAAYTRPLLKHFPEHRDAVVNGLQLPTSTCADSPMDPGLKLDDFTVERNLSDKVLLATLDRAKADNNEATGSEGASDQILAQKVVLKRFSDELQLTRELTAMRRIKHPFVGTVSGAFHHDHLFYLYMPRYEGGTLTDWLELHQGDAEAVLRVLYQLASGLSAVHAAGVIHCDIKAVNVMMTSNSPAAHPCVIDFDFATPDSSKADNTMNLAFARFTRTIAVGGTRQYLAPEVCGRTVDPTHFTQALDAFSLGVVLIVDVFGCSVDDKTVFKYPNKGDGVVCADTLRKFKPDLTKLIKALTARAVKDRATVKEAEAELKAMWEKARAAQHDEVEAAQRPVECVMCMSLHPAKDTVECAGGGHRYCGECATNLVNTRREAGGNTWMEAYRDEGVLCDGLR